MLDTTREQITELLDRIYAGRERLSGVAIFQHAAADDMPAEALLRLDALPDGEYTVDEAADAVTTP
ncbi:hypothetical protein GCM10010123_05640 [Pilimelia anulata]|uniref:Uncharacterized protein n=1 Tax=Pilimelia anulata TaxID=53371 RepID=A0A8J3AZX3_9ACTN|nr:hypothetical protein [Pilimelia anulata]GGJ78558.1 hypothetical protein GCM10010123_05640 [Pilimelia anulata]